MELKIKCGSCECRDCPIFKRFGVEICMEMDILPGDTLERVIQRKIFTNNKRISLKRTEINDLETQNISLEKFLEEN